jgi:hypothetical protein
MMTTSVVVSIGGGYHSAMGQVRPFNRYSLPFDSIRPDYGSDAVGPSCGATAHSVTPWTAVTGAESAHSADNV